MESGQLQEIEVDGVAMARILLPTTVRGQKKVPCVRALTTVDKHGFLTYKKHVQHSNVALHDLHKTATSGCF
jgi:hypothetical protein